MEPSPSDFNAWENLIAEGADPGAAARELGFGGSSAFKRADRQRHWEAMEAWRDNTRQADHEYVRDKLRENVERSMQAQPVLDHEGNPTGEYQYRGDVANRSLELLGKQAGLFGETVQVTGAGGGPIEIEDRSASLGDVARILVSAGALVGAAVVSGDAPRGALPAASDVLAEPSDSQRATDSVPPS